MQPRELRRRPAEASGLTSGRHVYSRVRLGAVFARAGLGSRACGVPHCKHSFAVLSGAVQCALGLKNDQAKQVLSSCNFHK
jgi:hypothetical protein